MKRLLFLNAFKLSIALLFGAVTLGAVGETVNLYSAVTAAGQTLTVSGFQVSPAKLFNGVTYATLINDKDPGERVLFSPAKNGVNPYVKVTIPDAFEDGKRIVLKHVDLYPVTYWSSADVRMPTEYRISGFGVDGREHELAHPKGLTYPNLGTNARQGEKYGVDVDTQWISKVGCRTFKFEFIDSRGVQGGNAYPFCLMEIEMLVEILPADPALQDLYGVRSFAQMLLDAGCRNFTSEANCWSGASNLFDGKTFGSGRWMGYLNREGGVYAELRAPSDFRSNESFLLTAYQPWTLSEQSRELSRAPTVWSLFGLADGYDSAWSVQPEADSAWVELDHASGKDWSSVPFSTQGKNTLGPMSVASQTVGYRAFRFRPLYSTCSDSDINVGLNELELFVVPVNRKGTLLVRADKLGCDFGEGVMGDGSLLEAAGTVTAPLVVQNAEAQYRVKGYRVETFDYSTASWTVGESVKGRSYGYTPDPDVSARLVWELESLGVGIDVSLGDDGRETVTYDPAPGEAGPYYEIGTELTLTANPNADVLEEARGSTEKYRSFFVRWEGDTNGIADVTSPTITFTVDGARRLRPVFRRDWLLYRHQDGTYRIKDGNFDLLCSWTAGFERNVLTYHQAGWVKAGRGTLDLSTKIVHYQTGEQMTVAEIGWPQLGSDSARRGDFSRIVLPRTLTKLVTSSFRDQTNLVEVVIDCPELTQLGNSVFTRDTNLERVVFKAPKLETISASYAFFKAKMTQTDASDWDLSSLKTFTLDSESRFSLVELGTGYGFRGTLTLPSVETVGKQDFYYQGKMTNVVLGSSTCALKEIRDYAFASAASLNALTLGCSQDLKVSVTAFADCPRLRAITFLKHVPSFEAMDVIITNATVSSRARVYVSPNRPLPQDFLRPIDGELDPDAPPDAVGVYQTLSGVRKAWIFHKESPFDPKGAVLIFR